MKDSFRSSLTHLSPFEKIIRWIPSTIIMGIIFASSNQTSMDIPNFGLFDFLVKKAGHIIGYALLSTTLFYGFRWKKQKMFLVFFLSIIYAGSDEFHQSYISGRTSSMYDVLVYDQIGTLLGLGISLIVLRFTQIRAQIPRH